VFSLIGCLLNLTMKATTNILSAAHFWILFWSFQHRTSLRLNHSEHHALCLEAQLPWVQSSK
jgi:hypothetical protein